MDLNTLEYFRLPVNDPDGPVAHHVTNVSGPEPSLAVVIEEVLLCLLWHGVVLLANKKTALVLLTNEKAVLVNIIDQ